MERFRDDYAEILKVLPGMTDLASVKYRDEAEVLAGFADPEAAYVEHILPEKIALAKEYVRRSSLGLDLTLILKTLRRLVA